MGYLGAFAAGVVGGGAVMYLYGKRLVADVVGEFEKLKSAVEGLVSKIEGAAEGVKKAL